MAESSQPQRQLDSALLTIGDLARALDVVFVEQVGTEFRLLSGPTEWLLQLNPQVDPGGIIDVVALFPMLEAFLPEAEQYWSGKITTIPVSDLWTERLAEGAELHLQARAIKVGRSCFLIIARADQIHRTQQQLQQYAHEIELLNREVERANRAKSDFLANMSHEIRTPMNAILGMADVLSETELTADQRRYVETFQRAGGNLLAIINDILDLSKVEAGHLKLENIPFDLHDVVERAVELIRVKAAAKGIAVSSELEEAIPRSLKGDPSRLRQVILNLLGNSLKFTDNGSLTLRIAIQSRSENAVTLCFAITDTGVGIPADKLGDIFESFSQADDSISRNYGGTGLGLSISKKFVGLMGGRIWVESIVGQGSTFFFTAIFSIAEKPLEISLPPAQKQSIQPCRILLADDSEDSRFLISAYLKDSTAVLDLAENGEVALQKLTSNDYDLVLMDVRMPILDGFAATQKFRQYERQHNRQPVPILALTADSFQDVVERSLSSGFDAHLSKPIRKSTLLDAIAKYGRSGKHADQIVVQIDSSISDIVPTFLANISKNPEIILRAVDAGDLQTVRTLGHNMKGTGTAYGLPVITDLGAQIEQAAKEENDNVIRSKVAELAAYLERLKPEYL